MKKISLFIVLAASVMLFATGCLKDKGYEDKLYGIDITELKAVALTQATVSPVVVGITGQAAALTVAGPTLTIEGGGVAKTDVHVKLSFSDAAAIEKSLTPLPTGSYSLSTMDAVIKAGENFTTALKLIILNSIVLDPTVAYGVGIEITSVDGGYAIAGNMGKMVIGFSIKNKYDGIYNLKGKHNRVPYTFPYDVEIHLVTKGANSVIFYWPEKKDVGHPIGTGVGQISWYGNSIAPVIVFNTTTDLVTNVFNNPPNTTVITMFTGAGSRVSKFDPATKKITVDWNYNGNPLRAFFDDLTYISPRP
jgi:hypothetical protein